MLLCANFVFGSCSLDEELIARRQTVTVNHHASRRGKLTVVAVYFSIFAQVYVYMWRYRVVWLNAPWEACNWLAGGFFAVDNISAILLGNPTRRIAVLDGCDAGTVGVQVLWLCFAVQHVWLVLSVPQSRRPSLRSSRCSKCCMHVDGMDHHCYFVHNCIGDRNIAAFLRLAGLTCCLSGALLGLTWPMVASVLGDSSAWVSADQLVIGVACVAALMSMCGSVKLLARQVWLRRQGLTHIQYLKDCRTIQAKQS